jgi:hypothetical protein
MGTETRPVVVETERGRHRERGKLLTGTGNF